MILHHKGYLTNNIDKTLNKFLKRGYLVSSNIIHCKIQNVKLIFLKKKNINHYVEIIQPTNNNTKLKILHKKINNNYYHICFLSKNFEKDLIKLKKNNDVRFITKKSKSKVFAEMIFLKKKGRKLLIEIVSKLKIQLKR
jgi:hypothetical protein